jgi:hypothetical protein
MSGSGADLVPCSTSFLYVIRCEMKQLIYRYSILLFILLQSSLLSTAQKGFTIQVSASPGFSWGGKYEIYKGFQQGYWLYPGWDPLKKDLTVGYDAGAALGYNFSSTMGLSIGALYSKQGQDYNSYTETNPVNLSSKTFERKVALAYLRIPLLFNYVVNPKKTVSFATSAGIYFSFLIGYDDRNAKLYSANLNTPTAIFEAKGNSYTVTAGSASTVAYFTNGQPYKPTDIGGIVSVGVQFRLSGRLSIPLLVTYLAGFKDIKNKDCQYQVSNSGTELPFWQGTRSDDPNADLPYRNTSLEITFGLKISLD